MIETARKAKTKTKAFDPEPLRRLASAMKGNEKRPRFGWTVLHIAADAGFAAGLQSMVWLHFADFFGG